MSALRLALGAAVLAFVLPRAPAAAEAPYRTVVVFGDTQSLVQTGQEEGYAEFVQMVDWVIANRERERIDFVLHVGDVVEAGAPFGYPLSEASCGGVAPDARASHGDCRRTEPCPEQPGFGCFRGTEQDRRCFSCARALYETGEEWPRFAAQWQRLEQARIPVAVVRGNHDNLGPPRTAAPLDPLGYRAYYGPEHYAELGDWSGYLESFSDEQTVSHAWRLRIGDQPVLVVGVGWDAPAAHLDWAERLIESPAQVDAPVIVLTHILYAGVPPSYDAPLPTWSRLVAPHPDRVFMAVWGHVSIGDVDLLRLRKPGSALGYPLLRLRSNWQGQTGSLSFLSLVRFHRSADGAEQVEVQAFSPGHGYDRAFEHIGGTAAVFGSSWLPAAPFRIRRDREPR